MVVSDGNPRNPYSHEAVLKESRLLCLGCHRRKCKVAALEKLPRWPRWKKKFDNATGLISRYRRVRKRVKKLLYLWQGGKLTGKSQFVN